MKLTKTKKILLLGITLVALSTSIAVPIVLLNKDNNNAKNDVEKIFKILQAKTSKEKIIELSSSASGKIIADNQEKIIEKIKALIGKENLKEIKIEVLIEKDTNISTTPQKIIIKLTKNEVSKEVKDFLVKKQSIIDVDKDIASIKKLLDAKSGNDLIITLPSSSTGNIIGNATNKNEIIKKLRMLVASSNTSGEANHSSLRETSIQVSMSVDAPISTTPQNIIVSISKTGGTTLTTTKTFQVKRDFTADEDIRAINEILIIKNKKDVDGNDFIITFPNNTSGSIVNNPSIKNTIERKVRKVIDPSNSNGDPNHPSLRGTTITLVGLLDLSIRNDLISFFSKVVSVRISKTGGTSLDFNGFIVKKSRN